MLFKRKKTLLLEEELSHYHEENQHLNETIQRLHDKMESLAEERDALREKVKALEEEKAELQHEVDRQRVTRKDSLISFVIEPSMKIRTITKINPNIVRNLVKAKYLQEHNQDDQMAQHLALVLIANEASAQVLEDFEGEPVDIESAVELEEKEEEPHHDEADEHSN